ncbi:Asp-tRNA(Asn)/Glu-tRNA(Gln) amidotransferase subunit GatB [Wohlfahrtiimonas chitiniclastica]|uniref:Asp-tRNA(Asn)/Glu-tRNA(Gln) amidotransferase subunit GatB n=1 Tax=Wohlfahrtiimonas chitiniclastica TaxID=400946 RepID=UPI00248CB1B5|nr:Asp-tRNA(Asn)/Glu-tRNA(Gln) amidotransferase subunit GatB [Wohlfahrtiimonas chitiniclastica]WHR56364.1 Asp-tRNA(Asn)/Glu-tRNA(Gln) amidotransferase subunit GatB [Wohlfahrtiimonas chitiniclastica]
MKELTMTWEVVIGLEVHTQLTTQTKLFSGSSIQYGAEPNTQASLYDLAMPGTLPVFNRAVLDKAILLGLAINAHIAPKTVFERKNYFYPDLPTGYQISQLALPIVQNGHLMVTADDGSEKKIRINRAHMECDAGKSLHDEVYGMTGIDLNRAGTPLLEIVTEPDINSAKEAIQYLRQLHQLVTWLGICDGNMQEGSFRCDANVSVHKPGTPFGTRAEIKNINSFRFIEDAINHEVARQIEIIEAGGEVVQETRLYDPDKNETRSMRTKEEANDYRYFPDPNLLPIVVTEEMIEKVRETLPELPEVLQARLISDYGLSEYDASVLTQSRAMCDYFGQMVANGTDPKMTANWLLGEVSATLNQQGVSIDAFVISADRLAGLLTRIADKTISNSIAKKVFELMLQSSKTADEVIEAEGLKQVTDTGAIEGWVNEVIEKNPKQVEQYKGGQTKLLGFFVGQVMKLSKGKADPAAINALMAEKLQ